MYVTSQRFALVLALCGLMVGCNDRDVDLVPVSGRVLIDGQPVPYGTLTVRPSGYRPAYGKLDENGHFELMTHDPGDGCVLGKHKVTINAMEMLPNHTQKWYAPKKYSRPGKSNITIDITEETLELEINLTWDGGKPFVEKF